MGYKVKVKLGAFEFEFDASDISGKRLKDGRMVEFSDENYKVSGEFLWFKGSLDQEGNFKFKVDKLDASDAEVSLGGTISYGPGGPAANGEVHIHVDRVFGLQNLGKGR